jgi:hypothetical protein
MYGKDHIDLLQAPQSVLPRVPVHSPFHNDSLWIVASITRPWVLGGIPHTVYCKAFASWFLEIVYAYESYCARFRDAIRRNLSGNGMAFGVLVQMTNAVRSRRKSSCITVHYHVFS